MEEFLIEHVRLHEGLYNVTSAEYRDKRRREEAWIEVGNEMQISAAKAKEMWEKLRRCLMNAMNRRRSKKSGQGAKKITPWKFEQQMEFLLPYLDSRKTARHLEQSPQTPPITTKEEEASRELETDLDSQESELDPDVQVTPTNFNQNYEQIMATRLQMLQHNKNETASPAQQMVQILKESADLRRTKFENQNTAKPLTSTDLTLGNENKLDESDMFYLSLSKTAKKLPKIDQAKLKLALSKIVLEAEIQFEEGQTGVLLPETSQDTTYLQNVGPGSKYRRARQK